MLNSVSSPLFTRKRIWLAWVGCICLLAACVAIQGCNRGEESSAKGGKKGKKGKGNDSVPVEVAKVTRKDVPIDMTAVGNVEAYSVVSVRPQVSGQLQEVFVEDGEYITKGQKLFQIDPRPFDAQVAQMQATLARDRAQLGAARANLARDIANEKYAREQANRYVSLFQQGVVSRDDQDKFMANADALGQSVEADKAAISSAAAQIQADDANLDNIKLQLSFTTIYAPIDGRAGNVTIKAGNIVNASQTELLSIAQVQPIYVTFSVPESRLEEIQRHMGGGRLVVEATGQEDVARVERGVLTFIDNNVDSTTGTIKLKGTFENTMRRLWPGEYANVTLKLSTQANALVIPNQAMQTGQDGTYVYLVKEDRTVEVRPITVGLRRESDLVIASGLQDGEVVVTQGQLRLAPGSHVSLPGEGGGGRGRNGGDAPAAEGPGNGAAKEGANKNKEGGNKKPQS